MVGATLKIQNRYDTITQWVVTVDQDDALTYFHRYLPSGKAYGNNVWGESVMLHSMGPPPTLWVGLQSVSIRLNWNCTYRPTSPATGHRNRLRLRRILRLAAPVLTDQCSDNLGLHNTFGQLFHHIQSVADTHACPYLCWRRYHDGYSIFTKATNYNIMAMLLLEMEGPKDIDVSRMFPYGQQPLNDWGLPIWIPTTHTILI